MDINWVMITALATLLNGIALLVSALLILRQLRQEDRRQFVSATAGMFRTWMDDDFQKAVQWVLYGLQEKTWNDFISTHRNDYGERAFARVGAYFNRIGYMVTHHLIGSEDELLLDIVAGSAISVWQKIEPLVLEARLIENTMMFNDFQAMLPECFECYVPEPRQ